MLKNALIAAVVFTTILIVWECYSRINAHLMFVLPAPSKILLCMWDRSDRLLYHTMATLKEMGGGFIIALVMAFPFAWGMYLWRSLRTVLQPLFVVIQCIPMFALAPIMVFWFGWSYTAVVIPTALMIFFPLTMNIYQGICSTPQHFLDYFRVNQATPWQIFWKLQLPWSTPHLMSGFRISAAIAGIGAVAGEWAGAQSGLGMLMIESRRSTDLDMTFAALFCLTIISLSLYAVTIFFERRLTRRHHPQRNNKLAYAAAALIPAMLLAGCGSNGNKKTETRLLLDWLPNPNHIPLYVGIQKGFFQKQGINLSIVKISDPGDSLAFITSSNADLALYYMYEAYVAMSKGAQVEPVGYLIKQPLNALIYRKGEGIETPQDLNGKKMGYAIGSFGMKILRALLDDNDIKLGEAVNVSFDLVSTMGTKRVDAIYGAYFNIECEHLRSLGIDTSYFTLQELGIPTYFELLVFANKNSPYVNPDFVKRFKSAMQASIDYSVQHPDEAYALYLQANPDKGTQAVAWERGAWLKTVPLLATNQDPEEQVWEAFGQWVKVLDQ